MSRLFPGDYNQDLNYDYSDADSLPSGSDFVQVGNRRLYQARGYGEVTKTKVTEVPIYLSTSQANEETKQLMKIPSGAMPYALRMVLPDDSSGMDTLEPSGGADTLYAMYGGSVDLAANAFPPRLPSGTDLIYDADSIAISPDTAYFANPQTAVVGEQAVKLHTGANGVQLNPNSKSDVVKVGVEIEFSLPVPASDVSYDRIVFF